MGVGALLSHSKAATLTAIVVVSFVMSSLGWRHFETSESTRVLVAVCILVGMYSLMVFELVNRNLAALIGAAASVAAFDCLVEFVEMENILEWEDLETLSLLFGMMIIVNVLSCSGLFDYLAVWSYSKSAGHFWILVSMMSFITALLSASIDNVSTMLLMSPTLIKLGELEHIDPRYLLMIMVTFCNIGGCATPVGDPPNLIIISDELVQGLGINFSTFVAYCSPCVMLTMLMLLLLLRFQYKSKESFRMVDYVAAEHPATSTTTTNSTNDSVSVELSTCGLKNESEVKALVVKLKSVVQRCTRPGGKLLVELERQVDSLEAKLEGSTHEGSTGDWQQKKQNQLHLGFNGRETLQRRNSRISESQITELLRRHSIKSKPILLLSLLILGIAIVLFFVQSLPETRLTLGWISLFAALTLLVASSSIQVSRPGEHADDNDYEESDGIPLTGGQLKGEEHDNFESVINQIEWSTLMFFFALFIVMEVMDKLGLIKFLGAQITHSVSVLPPGPWRSIGAITSVLWASALVSACLDNVPFTSMMVKVLGSMAASTSTSGDGALDMRSLVFALVFGVCYGGNATLIGASANLVTAGVSGRHNYPISFNAFFKFTAPITALSLLIANIYLVVVFVLLGL